jgi:hypothetical protein
MDSSPPPPGTPIDSSDNEGSYAGSIDSIRGGADFVEFT